MSPNVDQNYRLKFIITLTFISSIILITSPVSIENFIHDHFVFFDGAYRILEGQIPHVDFDTPLGGISLALTGYFKSIVGDYPKSLVSSILVLSFVVIFSGHFTVSNFLTRKYYYILFLFLFLVCISPYVKNTRLSHTSYAMWYNRIGWAYYIINSLYFLSVNKNQKLDTKKVVFVFLSSLVVFYLKPTFVVAIVPLLIYSLFICNTEISYRVFYFLSVVPFVLFLDLFTVSFNLYYFFDLLEASKYSSFFRGGVSNAMMYIFTNSYLIICFFISLLLKIYVTGVDSEEWVQVALLFFGTWWLTNQATRGIPLGLVSIPFWVGNTLEIRSLELRDQIQKRAVVPVTTVALGLVLLSIGPTGGKRLWTLADYVKEGYTEAGEPSFSVHLEGFENLLVSKGEIDSSMSRLSASNMTMSRSFCKYESEKRERDLKVKVRGKNYIKYVREGVSIVEKNVKNSRGVFVFDYVNPINLMSNKTPIKKAKLWYHEGRTFSESNKKKAKRWIESVKYVMIPKIPVEYKTRNGFLRAIGCNISRNFEVEYEGKIWFLLKKKNKN